MAALVQYPLLDKEWVPEQPNLLERVRASGANCKQLSEDQKAEITATLK